jgi:hypothetical protein
MYPYGNDHHVQPRCYFCGRALHVHEGEHFCPRCTAWTLTNPPIQVGALDGEPWGPLDHVAPALDHQPAEGNGASRRKRATA